MVSAASSGISMPNSSSNAMTSSTVSRLSAPRSSMNEAFSVTLSSSTPRCSTTIFFTRSAISLISIPHLFGPSVRILCPCPCRGGALVPDGRLFCPVLRAIMAATAVAPVQTAPPIAYAARLANGFPSPLYKAADHRSQHRHAAIHMQRGPGDIARLGARKVENSRRDFLGRPHARGRNLRRNLVFLLVCQLVRHRRRDKPGRDRIGRDAT